MRRVAWRKQLVARWSSLATWWRKQLREPLRAPRGRYLAALSVALLLASVLACVLFFPRLLVDRLCSRARPVASE
jgi:hypothetical protein